MKLAGETFKSLSTQILFFAFMLTANSVYAQYAQDRVQTIPADPRMIVIPARSMQEIVNDIDNATAAKQLALNRNAQAVNRLNEIELAIETRELSVRDIDRRKDDAGNTNRDSEEALLQIEAKANKEATDLLKRVKNLRKAEIEVAKVEEEHADMTIRVFQMESELQGKRIEYNWLSISSVGDLTQNTAHQVLRGLEVSLLKLQQDLANATQKVASKQKDVVGRRMKLHEARLKLGMSRT